MSAESHHAACLCGAVAITVIGPLAAPDACHCSQCRKQSGHYAAFTSCQNADLKFTSESTLAWYRASASAGREAGLINLLVALLVYVTYSNLISLVQAWIAGQKLSFSVGSWVLHAAVLALAGVLFWRRTTLPRWSLRRLVARA